MPEQSPLSAHQFPAHQTFGATALAAQDPAAGAGPDMGKSYDTYFNSGLYHARYPEPNRRTLRMLRQALPRGGRLLDYGAGEGRYCLSLAASHDAAVVAVDISAAARDILAKRAQAAGLAARMKVCDPADVTYRTEVLERGGFDVALLGFGVLGHIAGHSNRIALLAQLRTALAPGGQLILGLPNARRRFRAEQAAQLSKTGVEGWEEGDIHYERVSPAGTVSLFYHLFHRDEIQKDLVEAGYVVTRLTSESMFSERAVTHSRWLALADDAGCAILPTDWGYGYLVAGKAERS